MPQSSLRYTLVPMEMAARVLLKIRTATAERDRVTLHVVCVTLRWKPSRHSLFELVSEVAEQLQLPQTAKGVILRSLLATMDELTYGVGKRAISHEGRRSHAVKAGCKEAEYA